jgi:hypothetical protein
MTGYTMSYQDIPIELFKKFVDGICLDHQKCERVEKGENYLNITINVKNQN